jgi:hypothetical protein
MNLNVRYRVPESQLETLKNRSSPYLNISSQIREAMMDVVVGNHTLDRVETSVRTSTFSCPQELYHSFKELADKANMSFEEALRFAITQYLKTTSEPTQPHTQPQKDQDHATDIQT